MKYKSLTVACFFVFLFFASLSTFSFSLDTLRVQAEQSHEWRHDAAQELKADPEEWNGNYYLSGDVTLSQTVNISRGEVELCLNGHTLTLSDDASINVGQDASLTVWDHDEEGTDTRKGQIVGGKKSIFMVEGTLTVKGGTLTGGNADRGGGIYVDVLGNLTLENCTVSGNTAPQGGGVFVTGSLTLAGNTVVENNTDGSGNASNIFLARGNTIKLNGFTGRAGVTVISVEAPFAEEDETSTGTFVPDDKSYIAEEGKLKTAPLQSVTATYVGTGKVFPTTSLEALKEDIAVEGTNCNGVRYSGELTVTLEGDLFVGTCEITVTAEGEDGERAEPVTVTVEVVAPTLETIQVEAPDPLPKIYFDSPLSALWEGGYAFRGIYDDGNPRYLSPASEENEGGYTLEGDFTKRTDGKATITVRVGSVSASFAVVVSKHTVTLTAEQIKELSALEGGAFNVRDFVPGLPLGADVVAELGGAPLNFSSLLPGVYDVQLRFAVTDEENYEEIPFTFPTRLTVLRRELTREGEGGLFSVTKEGGLSPLWQLRAEDVTEAVPVLLKGSLEAQAVYELTVEENGLAVESPGALTVRIPLAEEWKGKGVTLFLLNSDGSLTEVTATRDESGFTFAASGLAHARYVLAVETASQVYLILSIVFGVACALGAAALLFYLVVKRKMSLR